MVFLYPKPLEGLTKWWVLLAIALVSVSQKAYAASQDAVWPVKITLSQRLRYEYLQNFTIQGPRDIADGFLLERFRLGALYEKGSFRAFMELQDAHGIDTHLSREDFGRKDPYENPMDLRQAYIACDVPSLPLKVKAGRQVIAYWGNRVFGPGEWGNTGRYNWDAFKLMLRQGPFWLDSFYARQVYNDPYHFDGGREPFHVWSAFAGWTRGVGSLESFLTLKDGQAKGNPKRHEHRFSAGVRLKGNVFKGLDLEGFLVPQWGKLGEEPIHAMGAMASVGYRLKAPWNPRVSLAYAYASGDKNPSDGKKGTFDGVFGAIDMYYGRMNLFSWQNLKDYQTSVELSPLERMKARLDHHFFMLDRSQDAWYFGMNNSVTRGKNVGNGLRLGHELDLVLKYKAFKNLEFQAGFGRFFPSERVKSLGALKDMSWYFFQTEWHFL
jgi:hypothetical protein